MMVTGKVAQGLVHNACSTPLSHIFICVYVLCYHADYGNWFVLFVFCFHIANSIDFCKLIQGWSFERLIFITVHIL